jgi:hypothetical protein
MWHFFLGAQVGAGSQTGAGAQATGVGSQAEAHLRLWQAEAVLAENRTATAARARR